MTPGTASSEPASISPDDAPSEGPEPLRVLRGRVDCYRLLDLGDELLLDRAEQAITESIPSGSLRRLKLSRTGAQALTIKTPPLDGALPPRSLDVGRGPREAAARLRLYDFGVASVCFSFEIEAGTPLADVVQLCAEVDEQPVLDAEARKEIDALRPRLGDALVGGSGWEEVESYTITYVEALEGHPTSERVLRSRDTLAKLLLGETDPRPLAAAEVEDKLRQTYAYLHDDLAIVDWEGAFVLEPSGSQDVPDLLEFACAQLVGLRFYDDFLDRELAQIYDAVEQARGPMALFSSYDRLAARVQERWLELTEFTDRIDNSIKAVGDVYLARVYRGALERFRLPVWQESVYRKQARIAQVYEFLRDGVTNRRTVILEVAIVVLILVEILFLVAVEL